MKIDFAPNNQPKRTGVASFISWDSAELRDAFRRMFHESEREEIVEVHVERNGITAWFETKNTAKR